MATEVSLQTTNYQVPDRTWHRSRSGLEYKINVTVDVSLFTAGTHYPNGYIPSGTVLGKFTATGRVGPYTTAAANGLETAVGILYDDVTALLPNGTAASKVPTAAIVRGDVTQSKLPFQAGAGSIDAAGKVDLPLIRFEA